MTRHLHLSRQLLANQGASKAPIADRTDWLTLDDANQASAAQQRVRSEKAVAAAEDVLDIEVEVRLDFGFEIRWRWGDWVCRRADSPVCFPGPYTDRSGMVAQRGRNVGIGEGVESSV